jgi:hypothetical protein
MTASRDEASQGFLQDAPDSPTTNFYLLLGDVAYGYSSTNSDFDAHFMVLNVGTNYTIVADNAGTFAGNFSTTFELRNSSGSLVGTATDFGSFRGFTFTAIDSLYYVVAHTPSGASYYSLYAKPNNTITETTGIRETIAPGGSYAAVLDYTSDSDHFLFTGLAGRRYKIDVTTSVPDIFFRITNIATYVSVTTSTGSSGSYYFTPPSTTAYDLSVSSNSFTNVGSYSFSAVIYPSKITSDFDADLKSDILWQNDSGQASIWQMDGTNLLDGALVGGNPGPSWHVKGAGDFDNDGKADILWQNDSGQAAIWLMNGTNLAGNGLAGSDPGPAWHVTGTGDFNDDGKADILWRNDSGQVGIWLMNGVSLAGSGLVANPGASWHVKGTGDFDGDNRADILLQNDSGQVAIWLMNGTTVVRGALAGGNPGASWHVKGAGDFDGDGKSDIMWQNDSGQAAVWLMNGTNLTGSGLAGGNPGPTWNALGTRDVNNDGRADILWQNSSGQATTWLMSGTTVLAGNDLGSNPGSSWHTIAINS